MLLANSAKLVKCRTSGCQDIKNSQTHNTIYGGRPQYPYHRLAGHNTWSIPMKFWVLIQNPSHRLQKHHANTMNLRGVDSVCRQQISLPSLTIAFHTMLSRKNKIRYMCERMNTWDEVPISGAGMSRLGPMTSCSFCVNTLVNRSSSAGLKSRGLHPMPPLAPPYGIFATADFQVMSCAKAFTSFSSTCTLEAQSSKNW